MTVVPFGEWAPDLANRNTAVLSVASGVIPASNFYGPFPAWVADVTATLPAACLSAFVAIDEAGEPQIFAGTAGKLYLFNRGGNTWDDVSKAATTYGATADERWTWAQFGYNVVAVNVNNVPQVFDLVSGTNFDNLGGSPPQSRIVATVGDFLVLANQASAPNKLQWSALNNITGWTVGTSFSDEQVIPDGGEILGISDGDVPIILQKQATRRFIFTGGPEIFQIDKFDEGRGLTSRYGYCRANNLTFFVTEDGLYATNGQGAQPIGANKVTRTLMTAIGNLARVQLVADELNPRVYIGFPSASASTYIDTVYVYDWTIDRFTSLNVTADYLLAARSVGVTLEGLDAFGTLDTLPASLDSELWRGGRATFGAIVGGQFGFFRGLNVEANVTSGDIESTPGARSFLSGIRPVVDTSNVYVSVGKKSRPYDLAMYTNEGTPNAATGIVPFRASARYHQVKVRIPASAQWTRLEGVQPYVQPEGYR